MRNIHDLYKSRYLRKEQVPADGVARTIRALEVENVAPEGQPVEEKPVLFFKDNEQGLVLNKTNADILAAEFGADYDAWVGKSITLYIDPNVVFGGKRTGGIRVQTLPF